MKARTIVFLSLVSFVVALAIVIGQRLSGEAMAVLLGVIAGVAASIPTSLIVVWLATRTGTPMEHTVEYRPRRDVEPEREPQRVVVVQPPAGYGYAAAPPAPPWGSRQPLPLPPPAHPRQFTVIGGASQLEELPPLQQFAAHGMANPELSAEVQPWHR